MRSHGEIRRVLGFWKVGYICIYVDRLNYMCVHEGLVFWGEWNERETIFWTHQDFILTQRGLFALTPNLLEPKGKRERERERVVLRNKGAKRTIKRGREY